MNIWNLKETIDYFRTNGLDFSIEVLFGPEEFKLSTVNDKLGAEKEIRSCKLPEAQTEYIIKALYE